MGDTLRTYLKVQNLFVRDINREASPAVVKAYLEKLGGPGCKVVLPLAHNSPNSHIGQAYLNFNTHEESKNCLDKYRFSIKFKDEPAKLMYAAVDRDRVYGPYSFKFQVIVKNLSEEVDVKALFEFFSKFGEIYQCKTGIDPFEQYFGQITYLDEESVAEAVAGANETRWESSVIVVEPHHKAYLAYQHDKPHAPAPDAMSTSHFPALGGSSSSSRTAQMLCQQVHTSSSANSSSQVQLLHPPPPPPSQQQQPDLGSLSPASSGPVNFALQAASGGSGALLLPQPFSQTPPAGGGTSLSPLDIPVAMPFAVADSSRPVGPLGGGAATGRVGGAGSSSRGADGMQLKLGGLQLGTASSGGTAAAAAAGDASAQVPGRLGTHHLLQVLERRRGDASSSSSRPETPGGGVTAAGTAAAVVAPASSSVMGRAVKPTTGVLRGLMQRLEQVSEALCCPITHEVFVDPVVAADGITYERAAIVNWLSSHNTSPMTNESLTNATLHPNNLVKTLVEEFL